MDFTLTVSSDIKSIKFSVLFSQTSMLVPLGIRNSKSLGTGTR